MKDGHFFIRGREIAAEPYHYKESGLDNIFLANGFAKKSYDGEEYVSIENVDGLWKAIGFSLVRAPRALGPKEVRFLRHHMDLTQADLAQMLRVDAQTVARWEKGKTEIQGPAEIALRFLVLSSPFMQPEGKKTLAEVEDFARSLADRDDESEDGMVFSTEDGEWKPTLPAAA